jgi:hypothetical protein
MVLLGIFHLDTILPAALWALGLTQPLTETKKKNNKWGLKAAGA